MNLGLIPIRNFGIVSADLYRSAQPQYSYEYQWLVNNLQLKQIISLRAEGSDHDFIMSSTLPLDKQIECVRITVKDDRPPTKEQVQDFITALDKNVPTLFHCAHGHGRTSTFSVIAKIHKGMSLEDAIQDEKTRFHYEFKHPAQEEFLRQLYK